jgi:hypothetical protein
VRKTTTFAELYADLDQLEERLSKPRDFYYDRFLPYLAKARELAEKTAIDLRPQDRKKPEWDSRCRRVADRVTAHLMLGGAGLTLSLPADPQFGELEDDKKYRPFHQQVTHADVVRWIEAGQAGIPGGKRITAEDAEFIGKKGINAKATIVMRAYYSRNPIAAYSRLRQAVQRYMHGSEGADKHVVLDAIAAVWAEYFATRFPLDLEHHVAQVIREF